MWSYSLHGHLPPSTSLYHFIILTGVGLFGDSEPLQNNSALRADSIGQIGVIHCHTASREALEASAQWHSSAGIDITRDLTDDYLIQHFSGLFPSFTSLELQSGLSLSVANQGVYSCTLPDENGVEQILFVGLYREDYDSKCMHFCGCISVPEKPVMLLTPFCSLASWKQGYI